MRRAVGALLLATLAVPAGAQTRAVPSGIAGTFTERLTSTDAARREAAIAELLARPAAVDPFDYAALVQALWASGRRRQAAFWFFVFQARTRPWADADTGGAGAAALRASLNDGLGTTINGWVGSDVRAWQSIARRAIGFEATMPLFAGRPAGVSPAQWLRLVATARAQYCDGFEQTLGKADPVAIAATRRANGLPLGPLQAPGPALPESWR